MFGFPLKTEINKPLPKKLIYESFKMSKAEQDAFDKEISRLYISNELSPSTLQIEDGKSIHSFFVILVELKTKKYTEKNLVLITKLIPQNMIFALRYNNEIQAAAVVKRFFHTQWVNEEKLTLSLNGLTMDSIWENLILQISDIELDSRYSLEQQITLDEKRANLQKHIDQLEKTARNETQPRKKLELFEALQALKKEKSIL